MDQQTADGSLSNANDTDAVGRTVSAQNENEGETVVTRYLSDPGAEVSHIARFDTSSGAVEVETEVEDRGEYMDAFNTTLSEAEAVKLAAFVMEMASHSDGPARQMRE